MSLALATLISLDSTPSASGAEIVVRGRSLDEPIGSAAYDSVLLTRERLTTSASGRIEDVLADVAGFQQFRRTDSRAANPTSQGATLRALGGNAASRALVLLDGIPQADPFSGFIAYSALRPERLSSVRVTRGGGAGAFGAGAVAGTIELFSGGPDEVPELSGSAFSGSRNASEMSAGLMHEMGRGFVSVNGGWDRGDGYILVPSTQRGRVDISARYDAWSVALRSVAAVSQSAELQASALVFDDHRLRGLAGTESRSRGADASLKLVLRGRWRTEALLYLQDRGFSSGFVATAADRSAVTKTLDQFNTPSTGYGGKIELRPPVGDSASVRLGADFRQASGQTHEFFRYVNAAPTRLRQAGGTNRSYSGFAEGSFASGPLLVTGGARLDHVEIHNGSLQESEIGSGTATLDSRFPDRSDTIPSLRFGSALKFLPNITGRVAAYMGFRIPTLNELYRPFRVGADATAANPGLEPERLSGYELGIDFETGRANLGLTAFRNRLRGAVANVTLGRGPATFAQVGFVAAGGVFRQRLNVDAISVTGVEASATVPVGRVSIFASWTYSDARVAASDAAALLNGKRPALTPGHQGSATLSFARPAFSASVTARYSGPQFEDDLQTRRLPSAFTVDTVAGVRLTSDLRLFARMENLFDEKVVSGLSATGVEDLGIPQTFWVGLRFSR